jgi:hypothetical protein
MSLLHSLGMVAVPSVTLGTWLGHSRPELSRVQPGLGPSPE